MYAREVRGEELRVGDRFVTSAGVFEVVSLTDEEIERRCIAPRKEMTRISKTKYMPGHLSTLPIGTRAKYRVLCPAIWADETLGFAIDEEKKLLVRVSGRTS